MMYYKPEKLGDRYPSSTPVLDKLLDRVPERQKALLTQPYISVTRWYCVSRTETRIIRSSPGDSPGTLQGKLHPPVHNGTHQARR